MSLRTCPRCGAPLAGAPPFCPACGAHLTGAARPDRATRWTLGVAGLLALLALLSFAGLLAQTTGSTQRAWPARQLAPATVVTLAPTSTPAIPSAATDLLLADDFASPQRSHLAPLTEAASRYTFADGAYRMELKQPNTLAWSNTAGYYGDVSASVDASFADATGAAGLIFHYQDSDNFYLFSISSDGYYALDLLEKSEWKTLIDWTPSDAIVAGRNTLRVELRGSRIALLANGKPLEETRDDTLAGGDIALALSSFKTGNVTILFDNLLIIKNS